MRIETFGPLRARVAGGVDREGGGDGPVVVLLHGYGAPGDDLASLWRVLDAPPGTRFVFPEAPIALDADGSARAWWNIDVEQLELAMMRGEHRSMEDEVPDGLPEAVDALNRALDEIAATLRPSRVALGGFSQGAMLSVAAAIGKPRDLASLVLLSGTLLARNEWAPKLSTLANKPIFMSHGRHDRLLSFAIAEALRDLLKGAGADVRWHPFNGDHEIPPAIVASLGAFLRETLV